MTMITSISQSDLVAAIEEEIVAERFSFEEIAQLHNVPLYWVQNIHSFMCDCEHAS